MCMVNFLHTGHIQYFCGGKYARTPSILSPAYLINALHYSTIIQSWISLSDKSSAPSFRYLSRQAAINQRDACYFIARAISNHWQLKHSKSRNTLHSVVYTRKINKSYQLWTLSMKYDAVKNHSMISQELPAGNLQFHLAVEYLLNSRYGTESCQALI